MLKITSIIVICGGVYLFFSNIYFNPTVSEPQGYYFIYKSSTIKRGDQVLFCVDDATSINIMHQLKLPYEETCKLHTPYLLKTIVAVPGDTITINKFGVYINNNLRPNSISFKSYHNLKLNPLSDRKLKLKNHEYFVLGQTLTSYDSRYFGIIKAHQIKFRAILLWPRPKPLLI